MNNQQPTDYDALFAGVIGQDYEMLKLICPLMTEMSRLVGASARQFETGRKHIDVVELGGGTGITTLSLLTSCENIRITSVDNEPTMQNQAKKNLQAWHEQGKLNFNGQDALSALQSMADESVDVVASAYTLHNFLNEYRRRVVGEIYRVLKPGGCFINGDRYALDDISRHTRLIQDEVAGYFKVLIGIDRLDLLEHWLIHLFSDESENHVMRESVAIRQLRDAGFVDIRLNHRKEVNALVTASKPSIT